MAATENSPTPASGTGVEGVLTIGPTHGGPVREGVSSSRPLARAAFLVQQEDRTVATFETDEQGRFRVTLPPGKYRVTRQEAPRRIGSCGPFSFEVRAGKWTKVEWDCDTGMR